MTICSLRWFAEDMVKLARWVVREAFDEIDARLTPKHVQQGWDEFLAEEEAVQDSWEPGELRHRLYCKECGGGYWTPEHRCGRDRSSEASHLSWGVDGATTQPPYWQPSHPKQTTFYGGGPMHGCPIPASLCATEGKPCDPICGECDTRRACEHCGRADGVHRDTCIVLLMEHNGSVAAAATDGPAGVEAAPPLPPPAGHPTELVDLIAEVLTEHYAKPRGFNRDGTQHVRCGCYRAHLVADWRSWREHVSGLIAERIHQAAPQIDYGDLIHAAGVVKAYLALGPLEDPTERGYLRALADRLADAGRPAFTP